MGEIYNWKKERGGRIWHRWEIKEKWRSGKDTKGGIGQALKRMGQGKKGRGWNTG